MNNSTDKVEKTPKSDPMEREFFVLKIDENNNKMRRFTRETVEEWVESLNSKKVTQYKIENVVGLKESDASYNYISSSLYCGVVTELIIRDNKLYAKARFKVRGPHAETMKAPGYFDNLTLVAKGYGKVKDNIIYDYELYGFNLVEWHRSAYFTPDIDAPTKVEATEA